MRSQKMRTRTRARARTAVSALALALVGMVLTALPASASAVTSFSPLSGPPGTLVTITGTGFTGMTGVDFDAGAGPDAAVTWTLLSDTSATAVVPCSTEDGPIRVNTPNPDTVSVDSFDATAAGAATITSFAPTSGPVGTSVVITGTNLCDATQVQFDTTTAPSFTVNSDSQITAVVPTGATTGLVHVTVGATADSPSNFTVLPAITSFAPTSGPIGTSVVITGTNLTGATSVTFNATAATTFTVDSATQITATVPTGATTGPIHVATPDGTANSATSFTVTAPGGGGGGGGGTTGTATITSFSPASGPVGTSVVITGTNLTGATSVTFNNVPATTFTVNSATQVTATVPSGATTGKIAVTIPGAGGTATSANDFTVTTAPTATRHGRSVNLNLMKHLVATGTVRVGDGFGACRSNVTIKIQRLRHHVWKTIGMVETNANGRYRERLTDRPGTYRVIAKKVVLNGGADICMVDLSAPVHHHD